MRASSASFTHLDRLQTTKRSHPQTGIIRRRSDKTQQWQKCWVDWTLLPTFSTPQYRSSCDLGPDSRDALFVHVFFSAQVKIHVQNRNLFLVAESWSRVMTYHEPSCSRTSDSIWLSCRLHPQLVRGLNCIANVYISFRKETRRCSPLSKSTILCTCCFPFKLTSNFCDTARHTKIMFMALENLRADPLSHKGVQHRAFMPEGDSPKRVLFCDTSLLWARPPRPRSFLLLFLSASFWVIPKKICAVKERQEAD